MLEIIGKQKMRPLVFTEGAHTKRGESWLLVRVKRNGKKMDGLPTGTNSRH
jgi:hypothetical protein